MRRVHRGAFSQAVLSSTLDQHPLSGQDKSLLTDLLYGTLRHQRWLEAALTPRLKRPDKLPDYVYDALYLASYDILLRQTPRFAAVNEWVGVIKTKQPRLAGLANAVLRRVELPTHAPAAVRYGVPDWLYNSWQQHFGSDAARVAAGMNIPEPLWISVYDDNNDSNYNNTIASLRAEGCEVSPGTVTGSMALRPSKPLAELEAFKRGWIQPQNPSSRLPVHVLEVSTGTRVFDLASGQGIKAAQLAALGAEVISVDIHGGKLQRAHANLTRLGLTAKTLEHDLRQPLAAEPAARVLLDAPCSGTGTLRGNPELRQRVTPEGVLELAHLQRQLLMTAAHLCTPGGYLVYAVCALTDAEGEANARWFADTLEDFTVAPFDLPVNSIRRPLGHYVIPENGLDGFYIARFRRN